MDIKVNDVYKFEFHSHILKEAFMPRHCFDGVYVVLKNHRGELCLKDTYWTQYDNRTTTLEDILKRGKLTFYCNLNNVEEISKNSLLYYSDEDIFDLSYQHGHYKRFSIRKGAKKNKDKIIKLIDEKIDRTKSELRYKKNELELLNETRSKIVSGNLEVYI